MAKSSSYRGRLAPSPTGYLHLGHARTFWVAWQRARAAHGKLIFRNEDLDYQRCKPEFVRAMYEDLHWLGLDWDEGLDFNESGSGADLALLLATSIAATCVQDFGPYSQSERRSFYLDAWRKLRDSGLIYPCTCSRKDLERALSAPHEEPLHGTQIDCGPQAPSPASEERMRLLAAGGGCGPIRSRRRTSLSRNLPRKDRNRERLRFSRRRELALQSP